jgi:hypothetical protein
MAKRSFRKKTHKRNRKMSGGFIRMNPADLGDTTHDASMKESLSQGQEFSKMHENQHGGFAPLNETGMLSSDLRASAHLTALDQSYNEIAGMKDQSGGRSRRRKSRRTTRGGKKTRRTMLGGKKSRRSSRRRTHGGASEGSPVVNSGDQLILPPSMTLPNLNPEWKLAEDPNSFVPTSVLTEAQN